MTFFYLNLVQRARSRKQSPKRSQVFLIIMMNTVFNTSAAGTIRSCCCCCDNMLCSAGPGQHSSSSLIFLTDLCCFAPVLAARGYRANYESYFCTLPVPCCHFLIPPCNLQPASCFAEDREKHSTAVTEGSIELPIV